MATPIDPLEPLYAPVQAIQNLIEQFDNQVSKKLDSAPNTPINLFL